MAKAMSGKLRSVIEIMEGAVLIALGAIGRPGKNHLGSSLPLRYIGRNGAGNCNGGVGAVFCLNLGD